MKDYKKILEGVVNIISTTEKSDIGFANICSYIGENCPELKESEDEKIRKALVRFHKSTIDIDGIKGEDVLAWLEKQDEHKKFRDSIQVGDKVTRNQDGMLVNLSQLNRVAKKQTEQKLYVNDNAKEMFIKALERVEEQNNKGYKLTDCDKNSWWEDFKAYTSCTIEQKPAAWSDEDEAVLNALIRSLEGEHVYVSPHLATKCLKSLKDRVHHQPTEWSKEDEDVINKAESWLDTLCDYLKDSSSECIPDIKDVINKLKSLRPKKQWKPSDEHIYWLKWAINRMPDTEKANEAEAEFKDLLEQLKKLREEDV